jgi:four helix bundle protein
MIGENKLNAKELKKKTKHFAHRCVKLAAALPKIVLGNHVGQQLIRCATSVAANYRATLLSQTKATFISKVSIVIEEADESEFWLEFIMDEKLMERERVLPLFNEAHELTSIFVATRKTAQKRRTITNRQSTIVNRQSSVRENR